eukprot:scaffold4059_cov393-Prasinococcus_capsulatus_cf.AAC.3
MDATAGRANGRARARRARGSVHFRGPSSHLALAAAPSCSARTSCVCGLRAGYASSAVGQRRRPSFRVYESWLYRPRQWGGR